ncbi:extracellular solute-binding protein [Nitratireductor rhodophyticola]|uniref:Extracellular solute-binding protein n=2 Tax=Nitratireductor rhodophyticola TaxID=2854036 RepID=A0ABS7RAH8_9HYPH|nr:extracellular solute-binding protein [Nitratireductor rhodophyticola]MBY8917941.1 extracellular solute-binding protein [Nitratireductor rhodophyticola]MBY8922652.1 extracellular solute-binding protein [Nitratireductor rhodophyticola]MEC9244246.1 extracellular solute-binding protein [Pseudomonadota bacterium]WPZ15994.1 extracellular solute-binding protein [Nitratireductor rhodophyticola]
MKRHPMLNRRTMLKGGAGAAALAMGGLSPFLRSQAAFAQSLADQQLRTIGLSVTVQDRILDMFKSESGVGSVSGTASTFPDSQTRILSGAGDYDCWEVIAERLPAIIATNNVEPIPTAEIPNWNSIRDTFTKESDKWERRAQIVGQIWADDEQTKLYMVPAVYNYDSIGYNPDVVSEEEANSWTALFDDKWRGRSGLNVDPLIAIGQAIIAMNTLGELEAKNPGNPTVEEIDEATAFLISKKKAGQFRALWGDFGELVNLMASGEMVVSDAWQPAVMAVKAQGRPAKYATPKEGTRGWTIGPSLIAGSQNREAVIAYANFWLSGPPAIAVTEQGYYSPSTNIKNVMDPDKYAFWYEGKPWVGAPERGINEGDLRDGGSLEERAANVAYWHQWPDEYDHLIQRWDEFLNA